MLKDHAHARAARRPRAGRAKALAFKGHPSRIGFDQAIDHLDEGRFARAIFTQQRVDLTARDVERNVIVRHDTRIRLAEPIQLQQR